MTNETFTTPCRPMTWRQVQECVGSREPHALHRRLTELAHYFCNCGYSSGWVPVDTLPLPSDFIEQHMPPSDPITLGEQIALREAGGSCV